MFYLNYSFLFLEFSLYTPCSVYYLTKLQFIIYIIDDTSKSFKTCMCLALNLLLQLLCNPIIACVSSILEDIKILGLNKITQIRLNKRLIYNLI